MSQRICRSKVVQPLGIFLGAFVGRAASWFIWTQAMVSGAFDHASDWYESSKWKKPKSGFEPLVAHLIECQALGNQALMCLGFEFDLAYPGMTHLEAMQVEMEPESFAMAKAREKGIVPCQDQQENPQSKLRGLQSVLHFFPQQQ